MAAIDEVVGKLAKINRQTAALLLRTVYSVDPDNEFKLKWARQCLNIAESGWHAWESTDAFIKLSPRIAQLYGTDDLLKRGTYGLGLCGYSFEPGHRYFTGLKKLLQSSDPDRNWENLQYIESTGTLVHQKYQHASNLLVAYFDAAFTVIQQHQAQEVSAWSEFALTVARQERAELLEFLRLSNVMVPWVAALVLQKVSVDASLHYVAAYPQLEHKYGQRLIENQQPLFLRMAAGEFTLEPFFTALQSAVLPIREAEQLFSLLAQVHDVRLATCLIEQCRSMPLGNHDAMDAWVSAGLEQLSISFDAALAFFSLESARSIDLLEKIKGQVNFSDCKRVLQMYAHAISGRQIKVDAIPMEGGEASAADFRGLTRTDGLCIFLPGQVSMLSGTEENFAFYKVALLHQLGYFEFDTFDRISYIERELAAYDDELLAHALFTILEDARVDWRLERRFRGAAASISVHKQLALLGRDEKPFSPRAQMLEGLVRCGLGSTEFSIAPIRYRDNIASLQYSMQRLNCDTASPDDTLVAVRQCYEILHDNVETSASYENLDSPHEEMLPEELPAPIDFHGELDVKQVASNMAILKIDEALSAAADEDMISLATVMDPQNLDIEEIVKGEVRDAMAMLLTELENRDTEVDAAAEQDWQNKLHDLKSMLGRISGQVHEQHRFLYDEWDYVIDDYRRRWCTLFEIRDVDESLEYVVETLSQHAGLLTLVRKQLNRLKPELLRKIKGVIDGDELDLERTVESVVDRKTGITPKDNIYIQRQRKDRDVSALFLLDMSASTDDPIPDPDAEPAFGVKDNATGAWDDDLMGHYFAPDESTKRIIDLEKEAVILMAEALEELGDNYSVCGFSGYGREQVDYFLCKDFDEPYDERARGRIGGIKPCRSTRMGCAIRHATRSLVKTESRIKALIIISDGYPQDFDYGKDRSSKDYGVRDTMKALGEARQQGVQAFCLTVDPSGHDYLREMCPDQQYMVIQDITQLPNELSKVYRSLTG